MSGVAIHNVRVISNRQKESKMQHQNISKVYMIRIPCLARVSLICGLLSLILKKTLYLLLDTGLHLYLINLDKGTISTHMTYPHHIKVGNDIYVRTVLVTCGFIID